MELLLKDSKDTAHLNLTSLFLRLFTAIDTTLLLKNKFYQTLNYTKAS